MLFLAGVVFSILHLPFFQRQSWQNEQADAGTIEVIFDDDIAAAYNSPDVTTVCATENGHIVVLEDQNLAESEIV